MISSSTRVGVAIALSVIVPSARAQAEPDPGLQVRFEAAKRAEQAGNYEAAIAEYKAILEHAPTLAEVHSNLGLLHYMLWNNAAAIQCFEEALKRKPDLPPANLFQGLAYMRANEWQKARAPLEKYVRLNPKDARAMVQLGKVLWQLGDRETALGRMQQAARISPGDLDVLYELGQTYRKLMTATYEQMAAVDGDSHRVHQLLAESYEARGEASKAIEEYQLAITRKPDLPGLHHSLGHAYWLQVMHTEAALEFRKELAIDPGHYLSQWKLGNTLLALQQHEEARQWLERALAAKPDLAQVHRDYGKLLMATGDLEGAIRHFREVVRLAPEEDSVHYRLASVYRRLGKQADEQAELEMFRKLRKARAERENQPGVPAVRQEPPEEVPNP
jgi:tetratricopeptide (TPR) repeat protein